MELDGTEDMKSRMDELDESKGKVRKHTVTAEEDVWLGFNQVKQNISNIYDGSWKKPNRRYNHEELEIRREGETK